VHGLGSRARHNVVAELVAQERVSILCVQETKLSVIEPSEVENVLSKSFSYEYVPANGSRGGIFVAWGSAVWLASRFHHSPNALTLKHAPPDCPLSWWLMVVYGPHSDQAKLEFLAELRGIRSGGLGPWLVCRDFNLIYKAADKNNHRLNRRLMAVFRNVLQLSELHLHGRLYTWSNEQIHPTLMRIDRAFTCLAWCDLFPHHRLRAAASSCSDHASLILHTDISTPAKSRFMFESIWSKFPGYLDVVKEGWQCDLQHTDSFRLDHKFRNTAKSLKRWSQKNV
jgi:hypothetical protein